MNDIKEELERQFLLNPDDEQLLKVIGMFNETFKETVKIEKVKQNVDEIVDGVISMLQKNVRTDDTKEGDECGKTDVKEGGKLGIDESEGTDDVQTGDKSVAQKKVAYKYRRKEKEVVDKPMPSFVLLTPSSQETDDDECEEVVPMNKPLDEKEKLLWNFVMIIGMEKKRMERKKKDDESGKGVYDEDGKGEVDTEEKNDKTGLSFMLKMFETQHGLHALGHTMNTLDFGKEISTNLIDCWAAMLNDKEKKMVASGKRQLFCYTSNFVSG
ncbi:hypothetical protein HanOQP8_Chr16g0632691 [Helianthus annuus]|nr:hypothetical protein HanHA89_Chr16g0678011 [Helianthus annuus]KAJ0642335.1 hypothetical protein HanLR1_Chr16g0637151 [Helianthus annuus]KAJ0646219.1 hypothetical protein HanOQP8_Chr16g0632691 [Helianthus annuus]